MVETYRTAQPYEERKSQNLGVRGYAKEVAWSLLPLMTGLAAMTFGKLTKQQVYPLDGSPDIFTKGYEFLFKKGVKDVTGNKLVIDEVERLSSLNFWLPDRESKLRFTHNFWNFIKGMEVGSIPLAIHLWRRQEGTRLDLTASYDRLRQLNDLKPTDEELFAENASLKQQLEYVQGHAKPHVPEHSKTHPTPPTTIHKNEAQLDGRLHEKERHRNA